MMAAPPAQVAGVQPPPSSDATVAKPAPTSLPCAPRVRYIGVQQSPCGQWTAHVLDQDQGAVRVIGPFPDEHAAALAHDRVAITFYGPGAHLNFKPAFYTIELLFLLRCRKQQGDMDVCAIVADGTYEARYAAFLRAVIALEQYGEFMDVMVQFYIDRAKEIGKEALVAGGEKLAAKFVEMHRNKAVDPAWRDSYLRKIAQFIAEKQQQSMEQKASDSSSTVLSRS